MNTDTSMIEKLPAADEENQTQPPRRRGLGLALLALFLALASLCGSGWLWWQDMHETQGEAARFAAELTHQGQLLKKLDARSGALESRLSALAGANPEPKLNKIEQDLGSLQQSTAGWKAALDGNAAQIQSIRAEMANAQARLAAAENRMTALSARQIDSSSELDLAEVDYLLRLAQERLALFGDAQTADRALDMAARQVAAFDDPLYAGLQQEIALARQKLSSTHLPDYRKLDQNLDLLQGELGALTFKGESVSPEQSGIQGGSGWWERIRNAFSGLVTVRRSTVDEKPLPVLGDQELIRQRAWLDLEVARWAALRQDQAAYASALTRFSKTVQASFDPSTQGMQRVAAVLRELQPLDVDPPMPDISAPLTTLRLLRNPGAGDAGR